MLASINPQAIIKLINSDIEACAALLVLLDQEQEALKTKDIEQLEKIIEDKTPLLIQLEKSGQTRTQWTQSISQEETKDTWNTLLKELSNTEIPKLWSDLKHHLEQCKIQNEVNGKMLARNQQVYGRLFNIIRGQNASNNLYNAFGESSGGARSQIVGEA